MYGFAETYRNTKDKKYLEMAGKIAAYMLHHRNKTADGIPYWDYNAPDIPNALRDVSTGSIMASALLELSTYNKQLSKEYVQAAELILRSLSSETYRAALGTNGGFLLKHGVGHFPAKSEVDVPLTYGDYYYVEALMRYKKLAQGKPLF